jgi:hypothetical protein
MMKIKQSSLKRLFRFFNILCAIPIFLSCNSNPLDVDVSDIEVQLTVQRMDKDLMDYSGNDYGELNKQMMQKYGVLYEIWMTNMLGEVSPLDPLAPESLKLFLNHPDMTEIFKEINLKFNDFSPYEEKFKECFQYYKYYFPDSVVPTIITFYSNFNANVFPYDNHLAIGLDMYLGADHPIVNSIPKDMFPQYIKDRMDEKYLVADGMKFWLLSKFANEEQSDFLSTIVSLGKVMYLLDCVLPNEKDEIKIGYTEAQLLWCKDFETKIWQTIVDEKVLYSKDKMVIMQYLNEGPFTKDYPHESPSRLGVWLGWQIVRDYMEYTGASVDELLKQKSAKVILKHYSQGER